MFSSLPTFNEVFSETIDNAAIFKNQNEPKRNYLGVSRWGEECSRRLYYEFNQYPTDEPIQFNGKTLRIFDMGHDGESRMETYLRQAGFDIKALKPDGNQYGFSILEGKLSGHIDGIIFGGPIDLPYPLIWENKALGAKSFKEVKEGGLKKSKPIYYVQMNAYMAYIPIVCEYGLFTAINRDTGEIYAELIPFDVKCAQDASDKVVKIISATHPQDVSRIANESTNFKCKYCPYREKTCWQLPSHALEKVNVTPSWI